MSTGPKHCPRCGQAYTYAVGSVREGRTVERHDPRHLEERQVEALERIADELKYLRLQIERSGQ